MRSARSPLPLAAPVRLWSPTRRAAAWGRALDLRLHVGAHKTASTHLQTGLDDVRTELAKRGTAYFGPHHIRTEPTGLRGLLEGTLPSPIARRQLWRACGGAGRLIASEENVLGLMDDNFCPGSPPGGFYACAAARVARVLDALQPRQTTIFMGLRDPADYYAACYRFHIQTKDFLPWSVYSARLPLREVSWLGPVRALAALPQVASLILWRWEDYPAVAPQILAAMLEEDAAAVSLPPQRINVGIDSDEVRRRYRCAGAAWDLGPGPFTPFGAAAQARSARRYRREVARLARLPKVVLLRPGA